MKPNKSIINLHIIFFLIMTEFSFSQEAGNEETIQKMKLAIKEFFIKKGEIDDKNQLGISVKDLADGSELGQRVKGIYLVRTEYRTDGMDYLFFKNGSEFEIVDLNDLKVILEKANILLKNESDETVLEYLEELILWYKDNQTVKKKSSMKIKIIKNNK